MKRGLHKLFCRGSFSLINCVVLPLWFKLSWCCPVNPTSTSIVVLYLIVPFDLMIPVPQRYQLFSTKIAVSPVTGEKNTKKNPRQVSEHDLIYLLRISVSHWRITLQSPTVWGCHGLSVIVSTLRLIVNWSFQSCFKAIFSPRRRLLFYFFSPRPLNLSATATPISKQSSIWGCRLANPPNVSWEQSGKKSSW